MPADGRFVKEKITPVGGATLPAWNASSISRLTR